VRHERVQIAPDVLFLHNFNALEEYDGITGPGELLELAVRLKKEGKAHCIGISTHSKDESERLMCKLSCANGEEPE
jgi:predicted aldo/keto reductase-like oxidoreductase